MPSLKLQQLTDKDTPVSFALKTINELRDWVPDPEDKFNISNVALRPRVKNNALKPRLMLCHDMAGGYKEDKLIQGNDYSEIYYVQYWHLTDIFI
jgi:mannosyl-glycoprotein endo-beta-N-acetylglucosaminidase